MKKIVLNNLSDFELAHIFECGQCFRWHKNENNSYTGVTAFGVMDVQKKQNKLIVEGEFLSNQEEVIQQQLIDYFDLNTDYSHIKETLKRDDAKIQEAIQFGYGIRILNQDPWEMLISFIISAANNIPRISMTIENIAWAYGKKVTWKGENYYLFPTPAELSEATISDLRSLNLGFRDKYVYEATKLKKEKKINLEEIKKMDYVSAKKELMQVGGVGEKVADCILLFSMKKKEAFPVDTWIKKIMSELYQESQNVKKIALFAEEKFGEYGGIAQQYLFYYRRSKT